MERDWIEMAPPASLGRIKLLMRRTGLAICKPVRALVLAEWHMWLRLALACSLMPGCLGNSGQCEQQLCIRPGKMSLLDRARRDLAADRVQATTFQALEKYMLAEPQDEEAHVLLGKCYEKMGLKRLAREQFGFVFKGGGAGKRELLASFKQQFASCDPALSFPSWLKIHKSFPLDAEVRLLGDLIERRYGSVAAASDSYLDNLGHSRDLSGINSLVSMYESKKGNYTRALSIAQYDLRRERSQDGLLAEAIALNGLHCYKQALSPALALYMAGRSAAGRQLATAYEGLGDSKAALTPALISLVTCTSPAEAEADRRLVARLLKRLAPQEADVCLAAVRESCKKMGAGVRLDSELTEVYALAGMSPNTIEHAHESGKPSR
jgi:hypothetical protein